MTVNAEKFQHGITLPIGDGAIGVRGMLPYEEKERMAQDYVSAAMVFDEETGIAYEGYNADFARAFLILRYYTDLDLTPYDTPQGWYEIYDVIASHGLWPRIMEIVDEDVADVDTIACKLEGAAKRNFERKHSLDYRLGRMLEGLPGTESLAESIAKAEGLNSKLIDMLGALHSAPAVKAGVPLAMRKREHLDGEI